jgi:hypothetical protein
MRTLRPHAPLLLAAAVVTLVSWPVIGDMTPRPDLDGAWEIALRQALHDGFDYGPDLLFTYGPLGFLREPLLVYPGMARLAFASGVLVHFVLCASLIWGLRHALGSLLLAALTTVLVAATMHQEPTTPIAFIGCVALAAGLARGRAAWLVALALGVLGGIELLSKLNAGATIVVLGVVALLAAPADRRRLGAVYVGGLAAALVIGWAAAGQSLGAVDDYVKGSLGVVSGYSETMSFEDPKAAWEFWAAFFVVGIGAAIAWRAGDLLHPRGRAGLLALWLVLAFTSWKAGFVRHDPGHTSIFFATVLGGYVAFGWVPHRRATAWFLGAVLVLLIHACLREDPANYVAPITRAGNLIDQAKLLASGEKTARAIQAAKIARLPVAQLDPAMHNLASRGGPLHIEPADAGLPWSQNLPWRPLPVFQSYSAYKRDLDERNAAEVRRPDGPQQILRENNNTIDQRNPAWESPAAQREMLCHFRSRSVIGRWILLRRTPPRCGTPRLIATEHGNLGVPAAVPPAPDGSSVVFVRIDGLAVGGIERLRNFVYRALPRGAVLDGGRFFRVVPGTAEDGLVMRVPKAADFPAPFNLDQGTDSLTLSRAADQGDVTLRFYAMSIR